MATWSTYYTKIRISANGTSYDIPVDTLTVTAEPYSRSGKTAVELFDGRRVQRIDGWRHKVELSWRQLKDGDHLKLYNALLDIQADQGAVISFDPPTNTRTINVVLEEGNDVIKAFFDGRVRKRPASVTFVSSEVEATPKGFINL